MGRDDILNRISADAEAEAGEIVAAAERQAEETEKRALNEAASERARAENMAFERAKRITEGRAAAARLESAKIELAEKRRVIDGIYDRALKVLNALGKKESIEFINKLLCGYAAEGDEVLLAENFAYAKEVSALPVFKEKNLRLSASRAKISGGVLLRGSLCDKDLSYSALLEEDREKNVADIAARLFASRSETL